MAPPRLVPDLTGQAFGRWTVIGRAEKKGGKTAWLCRCECGTERVVIDNGLKRGKSKSCGCLRNEMAKELGKTLGNNTRVHGHAPKRQKSVEYRTWVNMKTRCYNPRATGYEFWGGRGITVCDRWRDSFENFLEDMGLRPEGTSLDRIDVNGNYEPENCRWADPTTQRKNQRRAA